MTRPRITITSPASGTKLVQEVAIIRGTISTSLGLSRGPSHIYVCNRRPTRHTTTAYPVESRQFTVLRELDPGQNTVRLSLSPDLTDAVELQLTLCPLPPSSVVPRVRLVYLLTSDSDGSFQSPDDSSGGCGSDGLPGSGNTIAAGLMRFRTVGRLIQAVTADMLHAHGLGRRTFALEPDVFVHRLPITTAEAQSRSGMELWQLTAADLSARHNTAAPQAQPPIDVVVMSFSEMREGTVRAHTALGGGNLALFGGACLYAWPPDLHSVPAALTDTRKIDATRFFDDSGGRASANGRWAITATTIGALLHELGHCLSLPHPCGAAARDGGGIMSRGFDDIDRALVQRPRGARLPFWDRGSAVRLRHHRRIFGAEDISHYVDNGSMAHVGNGVSPQETPASMATPTPSPVPARISTSRSMQSPFAILQSRALQRCTPPQIRRDGDGSIRCRSPIGIGHVGFYRNGDNAAHAEFDDGFPLEFQLPDLKDLRRFCQASDSDKLRISAIDVSGQITEVDYDSLMR